MMTSFKSGNFFPGPVLDSLTEQYEEYWRLEVCESTMNAKKLKSIGMATAAAVVSLWLVGCATCCCCKTGRVYDDAKVAAIQRGVTTEAELVQWFGPPVSRVMGPDGSKSLSWKFPGKSTCSGPSGKLEVRLDRDGKAASYSAAAHVK